MRAYIQLDDHPATRSRQRGDSSHIHRTTQLGGSHGPGDADSEMRTYAYVVGELRHSRAAARSGDLGGTIIHCGRPNRRAAKGWARPGPRPVVGGSSKGVEGDDGHSDTTETAGAVRGRADDGLIDDVCSFYRTRNVVHATVQIAPALLPPKWRDICAKTNLEEEGATYKLGCFVETAVTRVGGSRRGGDPLCRMHLARSAGPRRSIGTHRCAGTSGAERRV
jgi:hypothetical protein